MPLTMPLTAFLGRYHAIARRNADGAKPKCRRKANVK